MTAAHEEFTKHVRAKLEEAVQRFGVKIDPNDVDVEYNINGRCAGRAIHRNGKYTLQFNAEAIEKHWDEMVKDTIPHEVAHLVCFAAPIFGKNHDHGWKRVCRTLGGDDSRTHDMILTGSRDSVRRRYNYVVEGHPIKVGPKHHAAIQNGRIVNATIDGRTFRVWPSCYQGSMDEHIRTADNKQVSRQVSAGVTGSTKRDRALAVYRSHRNKTRAEIISMFIGEVGLTPAGAATYYQNFKKANL